jgi:hypothetical protein
MADRYTTKNLKTSSNTCDKTMVGFPTCNLPTLINDDKWFNICRLPGFTEREINYRIMPENKRVVIIEAIRGATKERFMVDIPLEVDIHCLEVVKMAESVLVCAPWRVLPVVRRNRGTQPDAYRSMHFITNMEPELNTIIKEMNQQLLSCVSPMLLSMRIIRQQVTKRPTLEIRLDCTNIRREWLRCTMKQPRTLVIEIEAKPTCTPENPIRKGTFTRVEEIKLPESKCIVPEKMTCHLLPTGVLSIQMPCKLPKRKETVDGFPCKVNIV